MKKTVLAIFAHPDDEAFGPAGTLASLANTYDVQLICVTNGAAGEKNNDIFDLSDTRKKELELSAHILGISKIYYLGYEDGKLCNGIYQSVMADISGIVETVSPETIITFEPQGLTGHLDHIAVTSIVYHIFHKTSSVKQLYLYCLHEEQRALVNDYFVYFPRGYSDPEIHVTVDISKTWDKKNSAMQAHGSQKNDTRFWRSLLNKHATKEHFLVHKK